MSSGDSASPSSLESRPPSPAVVAQLWGDGSELETTAGATAGSRGAEVDAEEPPGTLGMCALASRSFSVDSSRPLGQWDLLGLAVSADVTLWLELSFPPCAASFSFDPSFSFSLARPLCSARRMSNCFLRPGTARRWVKE